MIFGELYVSWEVNVNYIRLRFGFDWDMVEGNGIVGWVFCEVEVYYYYMWWFSGVRMVLFVFYMYGLYVMIL